MEIVLDTWTTNKTNGSKYDPKFVLRRHLNRHHKAKLKMWTQKFDLIENICVIRTTYQRDLISPPQSVVRQKRAFIIYGIYRPVDIISICHDAYLDISAYQLSRSVSKVSRLVNKLFDLIFQASEYEKNVKNMAFPANTNCSKRRPATFLVQNDWATSLWQIILKTSKSSQ